jgi:transcriptional regulator with XRE-family HTH domain
VDDPELGRRIAYWRERRGMTQQLFADRIGRSKSWIEKVEAGSRSAGRLSVLEKICEVLRIDLPVLTARDLVREAHTVAARPESGRDEYHTAFGPVNVGIHRVSALVELGEGEAAVDGAALIPKPGLGLLRRERRANHLVDVARGYSQLGKADSALTTLLDAEQFASAEVRCRPMARAAITDLLRRSRGAPSVALRQLADRAGVAA